MKYLSNFSAPVFTRTVWHSGQAERTWAERVRAIGSAWTVAERESVRVGIRDSVVQPVRQIEYLQILAWAQRHGLFVSLLRSVKAFEGFAHRYEEGSDYLVTAIARDPEMLEHPDEHLGYPDCCRLAFKGRFPIIPDPMWQWASGTDNGTPPHRARVTMLPGANPLLRYLSIRLSPHIPCSADCKESQALAERMAALLPKECADDCWELLSLPVTWDCYRGVAIITTEPFRIIIGSCPTSERYIVEARI